MALMDSVTVLKKKAGAGWEIQIPMLRRNFYIDGNTDLNTQLRRTGVNPVTAIIKEV